MRTFLCKNKIPHGTRNVFQVIALSLSVFASTTSAATFYPANNGFESPNLNNTVLGDSRFVPVSLATASWVFSSNASIGENDTPGNFSVFGLSNATNGNNAAVGGATSTNGQAGFLQNGDGLAFGATATYFSQTFSLAASDSVTVTFDIEGQNRAAGQFGTSGLWVAILPPAGDPSADLTYLNATAFVAASQTSFNTVTTTPSYTAVASGTYSLYFIGDANFGTGGSDRGIYVDNVSMDVTSVPEPSAGLLLIVGGLGLAAIRSRRGLSTV